MNQLIAFVGFKSAGKNTAAQPLIDHYGYKPLSYADALKDALAAIFCWPRDLLEGITDESRLWREQVDHWWAARLDINDFTPRWAMMNFGTEIMRKHFNPDIWVLNVERRIELLGDHPIVLIDARFPNEIALARRFKGQVVRIQRGADPAWMSIAAGASAGNLPHCQEMQKLGIHPSEWSWVNSPFDVTLQNDGSIVALQAAVLMWMRLEPVSD
jgi:hypothetical protein